MPAVTLRIIREAATVAEDEVEPFFFVCYYQFPKSVSFFLIKRTMTVCPIIEE